MHDDDDFRFWREVADLFRRARTARRRRRTIAELSKHIRRDIGASAPSHVRIGPPWWL